MSTFYYPTTGCGSGSIVPLHSCSSCPDKEKGKIRHAFFYKASYSFISPESKTEWQDGLMAGNIQLMWGVNGSYDGGSTSEEAGFGDAEFTNGGTTHVATFRDPNYFDNCDFYNAMRDSQDWKFGFVTENYVHFSESPVSVSPKNPVSDDIKSIVTWEVQVKWSNSNSPCPFAKPASIFDQCFVVGN